MGEYTTATAKDKLQRYQREAFRVLWHAFKGDVLPAQDSGQQTEVSTAEQNLEMVVALYRMAEAQVEFERRMGEVEQQAGTGEEKRTVMAKWLRGFVADTRKRLGEAEGRISSLELQFDARPRLTTAEAAEVALSVKNVAYVLAGRGVVGSYAKVYSALYREFGVNAYPNIYRERFVGVIAWLKAWYDELVAGNGGAGRG